MAFDVGLLIGFLLMPESPSFLARKGKWDQCRKALASLRSLSVDDPAVDDEMHEVAQAAAKAKAQGDVSYREIFSTKDRILWRVMIGVCVQIGQQITGVNFFFSYGPQFAQTAGLDDSCEFALWQWDGGPLCKALSPYVGILSDNRRLPDHHRLGQRLHVVPRHVLC
jgi:hypothetical protein